MLNYLKQEANRTVTENGAATFKSTGSECLDLFATIGALRSAEDTEVVDRFIRAYTENPDLAMKLLFYARDVRGGLGERRVFRIILSYLAKNYPKSVEKNIEYIAEFGRYDDLLALFDTPCEEKAIAYISKQLKMDIGSMYMEGNVSLLAKWLPSVNASNADTIRKAKKLCKALSMNEKTYRQTLVKLRKKIAILENYLREKDYSFSYEKQPSRAMYQYRRAFMRNDQERYTNFIERVGKGEAKLHTENLTPYDLVSPYLGYWSNAHRAWMKDISEEEAKVLNTTWDTLTDFSSNDDTLAVVDTSGSMHMFRDGAARPAAVALSLGLYFAEKNKGRFRNHFIEFSDKPELIEIKGERFTDRLRYISTFNRVANTNLEAVFELILKTALTHHLPQEEMPSRLVIISDMEFDTCVGNAKASNFEWAKWRYESNGYKLPSIVFWNVASRNSQQPVRMNEQGVALVSGASPRLFSMITDGELSPYNLMMDVLGKERYACIKA